MQASRHGDVLTLLVVDTGLGVASDTPTHAAGFGLTQVRERLATAYGSAAQLTILSGPEPGVRIRIDLPCRN